MLRPISVSSSHHPIIEYLISIEIDARLSVTLWILLDSPSPERGQTIMK